ncbi:MAG: hypothetical protein DWI57_08245 [Chloroflexi bacterium]|nr:MAG: hypothetical protein DWI57_08245 [Chloroflexota bacterium]
MRFLVDECAGPALAAWLRSHGYNVFSVYDEARGMDDIDVIRQAYQEERILVTADKDFGEKVYRERYPHRGVVLMRLEDETASSKISVIQRLLNGYGEELQERFVVVTEKQVRFARS